RHPTGAIRLVNVAACRKRSAPVEYSDIVKTEETALKDISSVGIFPVHPPGEVQQQFMENAPQKNEVAWIVRVPFAPAFAIDLEDAPGCPGVHRGINVTESPFVCR